MPAHFQTTETKKQLKFVILVSNALQDYCHQTAEYEDGTAEINNEISVMLPQ